MSAVTLSSVGPSKRKPGVRGKFRLSQKKLGLAACALLFSALSAFSQSSDSILPGPQPPDAPPAWKRLVGIYADKEDPKVTFILLEQDGKLFWRDDKGTNRELVVFTEEVTPVPERTTIPANPAAHNDSSS